MKRLATVGLVMLAALSPFLGQFAVTTVQAVARAFTLNGGDTLTVEPGPNSALYLNGQRINGNLVVESRAQAAPSPSPSASAPPVPGDCAALHASFVTTGPDGKQYATWHPPVVNGCTFGHEHGSDPRLFPGFPSVGMPAFDYASSKHGVSEPHNGFKVFVVRDDPNNLWYLGVMHQGSGGAARAFVQFHSLDLAVARSDGTLLASVHGMADTGAAFARCSRARIPGSGSSSFGKSVPVEGCEDTYESWPTVLTTDGFRLRADWDIDNAMTILDDIGNGQYSQTQVIYHCPEVQTDPNNGCDRYGDKRELFLNGLSISNGRGEFTDSFGVKQYVRAGVTINFNGRLGFANLPNVNGQVFDSRRAPQIFYAGCVASQQNNDCTGRNFGWRTVRPPN